jgi:spore maturation protein CgeB
LSELFAPGREILLAESTEAVVEILLGVADEERRAIGSRLRERVLAEHSSERRAAQLEAYLLEDDRASPHADPEMSARQ